MWLNATEKDPEVFEQPVIAVCQSDQEAPARHAADGTQTVRVDEMTGLTPPKNPLEIQSQDSQSDALMMRKFGCGGLGNGSPACVLKSEWSRGGCWGSTVV